MMLSSLLPSMGVVIVVLRLIESRGRNTNTNNDVVRVRRRELLSSFSLSQADHYHLSVLHTLSTIDFTEESVKDWVKIAKPS